MTLSLLIGVPTVNGWLRAEVARFLANTDPANVYPVRGFLTDVARNQIVAEAQRRKVDVLMMIDADADPAPGTFGMLLRQVLTEECIAGVPFCTSAGQVAVYTEDTLPIALPDAVGRTGLQRVGCIGTHVVAYRLSIFERIAPPYFEYIYNARHTVILDTEDCVCHRKLKAAGVPIYCDFDRWAGHWKEKCIGKPEVLG